MINVILLEGSVLRSSVAMHVSRVLGSTDLLTRQALRRHVMGMDNPRAAKVTFLRSGRYTGPITVCRTGRFPIHGTVTRRTPNLLRSAVGIEWSRRRGSWGFVHRIPKIRQLSMKKRKQKKKRRGEFFHHMRILFSMHLAKHRRRSRRGIQ